ncbi:uncharacterized protein LOC143063077 [Mytilus galloprovincialis]|uniref:uncharacterized protein LOC143063077 n=1 Tax=Mytilus galloprovincialis TaxID=29158 RepID=UPI003F7C01C0
MTFETLHCNMAGAGAKTFVDKKIAQRKVLLFSKSTDPDCNVAKNTFTEFNLGHDIYEVVEIEKRQDCTQIENYFQVLCLSDTREVPQLFIDGKYIGGWREIPQLHKSGKLAEMVYNWKKK